ncbi:MAG: hypothetical protein KGQ49_05160 [Verrucomicrobia bacterium]|nr:hypothetical protein [Verrucomicrobiota bacterium]MDE3047637.1 hypothetical protein [Verrucomicrobiota bacterium]
MIMLCCWISCYSLGATVGEVDALMAQLLCKDCIVKSQQINIPEYRQAYNPSMIPYKGGYLLSFRYRTRFPTKFKNAYRDDVSLIGVVKLDQNFKVVPKTAQILNIVSYSSDYSLTAEDARLFNVGNRIFIIFNDIPMLNIQGLNAMYLAELVEERGGLFALKDQAKPLNYLYARAVEKNWSPFVADGKLYVIYSDHPRVILEVDVNTGYCQEVTRSISHRNWDLGEIRGGTPAYLVNDQFLTVFHSSFPVATSKGRAYVMGAYTFDKEPPFAIHAMTPNPLGDPIDYSQNNASKVVFPGGMVVEDQQIHVAWGKADYQIMITTFDTKKLLESMQELHE